VAYHRKHHRHHDHRHNPSKRLKAVGGVVKDAAWVAAGAIGAAALPGMVAPTFASGWTGVAAKAAASVASSFLARMVGGPVAASEVLKGGLAITVLSALNQAGIKTPGLGLYAPSWFAVPTASSQYLQAAAGNQPGFNRGGGTIVFPGPQGMIAAPAVKSNLGYHRFRSRYAGSYG
jgi:hypothetical protein